MPDQRATGASAPLDPLAAFTLVLAFPGRTFKRISEHPHWIMPLLFVVLCAMVSGAYAVVGGHLDGFLQSMALRTGQEPGVTRSAFLASTVLSSIVGIPLVLLLEALFYRLAGMLRGGKARFAVVFSAVAYASVPIGLGALAIAGLMAITGSHAAGANLAFLVDGTRHPVLWSAARQLDLFSIWFFILLGIAAEHVFELPRPRARQVGFLFAAFYLLIMIISGVGNAGQFEDPYASWTTIEAVRVQASPGTPSDTGPVSTVVIHHAPGFVTDGSESQLADAQSRLPEALDRAQRRLGLPFVPRIDVYLYPSRDAKRALTDNGELAHAVEWASAVHVAWVQGGDVAFAREGAKVSAAGAFGSVYNPFIRDGLGVAAGRTWGGESLRAVGAEILAAAEPLALADLMDPVEYDRIAAGIAQPLAGSFIEFVIETRGVDAFSELYRAQGAAAGPATEAVETVLGASLTDVETQWKDHLRAAGRPAVEQAAAARP